MELLGIWKLKDMLSADETGLIRINRADIEAMPDDEDHSEYKQMLRADFIISESALDVFYKPLESEIETLKEEGWEITERGVLIESFPSKIEGDQLLLNYEKDGNEYFPVEMDEEGCLIISDGLMKIEKA